MSTSQPAGKWDTPVFQCGQRQFAVGEVIVAAHFRGELETLWNEMLRLLAREKQAGELSREPDEAALQAAAEAFRYERDLITAEETEQWLAQRGLTLEDFGDYFIRRHLAGTLRERRRRKSLSIFPHPKSFAVC